MWPRRSQSQESTTFERCHARHRREQEKCPEDHLRGRLPLGHAHAVDRRGELRQQGRARRVDGQSMCYRSGPVPVYVCPYDVPDSGIVTVKLVAYM